LEKKNNKIKSIKIGLAALTLGVLLLLSGVIITGTIKNNKIKEVLESYNNIEAPQGTFLRGLQVRFNNVECKGIFSDTKCTLNNVVVHGDGNISEDYFNVKNVVLTNIESIVQKPRREIRFNLKINEFRPIGKVREILSNKQLKNEKAKELSAWAYNQLFPINAEIDIDIKIGAKDYLSRGKGDITVSIDNKAMTIKGKANIFVTETLEPFSVLLDSNGTLMRDKNITNIKVAEFKMGQKYFTKMNRLDFSSKNKKSIKLIYKMYLINMYEYKGNRTYINENFLGVQSNKVLLEKEFKKVFTDRLEDYKKTNPMIVAKQVTTEAIKLIKEETTELQISLVNKTGISIEEYLVLTNMIFKDKKEQVIEDNFNFTIRSK